MNFNFARIAPKDPAGAKQSPYDAVRTTLDTLHIDLGDQCHAVDRLHALVTRRRAAPSDILTIEGGTGVGKSRIIDLASGIISSAHSQPLPVDICRVRCEGLTGTRALTHAICSSLKVAPAGVANPTVAGSYIRTQLINKRKSLLFIDNAHLLADQGDVNPGVIEILGSVVSSGAAPLVLVGRQSTTSVGEDLAGAVGRTHEPLAISPFKYEKAEDLNLEKAFLGLVAEKLNPLLEGTGVSLKLYSDEMARRFWAASWGKLSVKYDILSDALQTALSAPSRQPGAVSKEEFAEAWRRLAARNHPLKINPFLRDDPPSRGEIEQARTRIREQLKAPSELPRAPRGPGAWMWA